MNKLASYLALSVLGGVSLAGCDQTHGISGTYETQTTILGQTIKSGTIQITNDYLITEDGSKLEVDEWDRNGDQIIARDENGKALLNVTILEGGKVLEQNTGRLSKKLIRIDSK